MDQYIDNLCNQICDKYNTHDKFNFMIPIYVIIACLQIIGLIILLTPVHDILNHMFGA